MTPRWSGPARENLHAVLHHQPAGAGTGLGLSISYDIIVQMHKGSLRVESEEGSYTEFIVTLPKNT